MDTGINVILDTAEAYLNQELFHEALDIYKQVLKENELTLDELTKKSIKIQISNLQEKILEIESDQREGLSVEEVSVLKNNWSDSENEIEILDSASAFQELGLFKESLSEYLKLIGTTIDFDKIITGIMKAVFSLHAPSRVRDNVEKIIRENKIKDDIALEIRYSFAKELEKKGNKDFALELYETISNINNDYKDVNSIIVEIQGVKSYDSRYGYLLEKKIVTSSQLQNALTQSKKSGKSVESVLMEEIRVDKSQIGKSLSYYYQCKFKEYDERMPVPVELLSKLKKVFLKRNIWVPLSWEMTEGIVEVFIDDPKNLEKTDNVASLLNAKKIKYSVGIKEDIIKVIDHFYDQNAHHNEQDSSDDAENLDMILDVEFEEEEDEIEETSSAVDETSSQIVRMVDQIIITAYRKGASDIHIEPSPALKRTIIRFRIDGVCQEILKVPISNSSGLLSRIKIMSNLDIAERRLPQDGKIKFKRKGIKPFELRVATLPTAGGYEDAVLRILADSGAMSIDQMGINQRNLDVLKNVITQPYGILLVVGPTGSGKTTTLHSSLGYINKPGIKIWTAEDPVEITQQGLRQVECKPKIGLDFSRVMRAFLRADPDVIMIGEMRDYETASIGIEASLTGHLVLSTLHTNSAPETITRLLDMGLNALNFSDAFLGVLAQRLVRRLCKHCKDEYTPSKEEFDEIVSLYGEEAFEKTGIEYSKDLKLYRPVGCEECSGSGYKGRLAIHELMAGTPELKQLIKKQAPTNELFVQAAEDGMTTLIQDGIVKSFEGHSDVAEIRRVCVS